MKKITILFIIGFLFVSLLLYSSDSNKVDQERLFLQRNAVNAEHLGIPSIPSRDAGDILSQFNPPISPWGVGYDGEYLWLSDAVNGDTTIYQYAADGTATGATLSCPWMGSFIGDMAYSPGYIFAVNVGGDNNIYKIDEVTGDVIEIISGEWNTISARGLAYDEANDEFYIGGWNHSLIYHIDATGATLGTFAFASVSGLAWHPMGNNGAGTLFVTESAVANNIYEVDPTTGAIIQQFTSPGADYACAGLALDYMGNLWAIDQGTNTVYNIDSGVPMGDPGAPAAPTDLTITVGASGALTADLSWTNPSLTIDGSTLTELSEILVYRGEDLIYTNTNPTIGGADSYFDPVVPAAGNHTYYVMGNNSLGDGLPASVGAWIGEDVPDAVTDFTLTDISTGDLEALLEWVNPTAGMHGGYFSGVTGYDFERSDGFTFSIAGPVTQWIDDTITDPGIYSYTITPFNDSGNGPSTSTAQVGIGVSIVQIGNEETGDYQIPINLWYMDSMVEVIYLQEWIGTDMLINAVSFHANTTSTLPDEYHLEIWMGVTDQTDLSAGWIDGSQLTEVFNGNHIVPPGDSWIDIPLDSPFEYEYSGNLVMMIIRDDDQYFSTSDLWWCTESSTPFRTRYAYTDNSASQEFNAMTGPFTSTMEKTIYPDVRFAYSELGHGDVDGVITDNATSNPIAGVEVYVGNWGPAITNASGEYLIEDLVIGIQPVTATKDGYYDFFGSVEVLPDEVVTYDFGMDANLFGALDGTVTDADSGEPLVGAEINAISAGGYEYYEVTNDDGYYSIVDVVAETYDVFCSIQNYPTEVEEDVVIGDGELVTVDFALEGYAYWNDFENNDGGLISDNAAGWQWGIPSNGPGSAYSGDKLWGTVLGANYPSSANFTLDTPVPFFIASPLSMLEFYHWYDIENSWDGGNVKVSADGGTSWSLITPLAGYTGVANSANPLYPEEIFCGTSPGWELVQFDLSGFQGQSIIIRWHFGSDGSVEYPGWFIDDVSISGATVPDPGWLEGTVTEFGTGTPIEGAIVSVVGSGLSATTEPDGTYDIQDIWPGDYDIVCVAPLYLDSQELGFTIAEGANTLDFSLLWSEIAVDVDELTSYLPPDDTEVQTFIITNNGPGDLEYSIGLEFPAEVSVRTFAPVQTTVTPRVLVKDRALSESGLEYSPMETHVTGNLTDEIWDIQGTFRPIDASGVISQAGMEFDGTYFYCPVWNSSDIVKYDIDGNHVETFQVAGVTGTRDLAYDGQYMYGGSSGSQIYCWDPATYSLITTINSTQGMYRAIAYDSDNDGFLGNNWDGQIVCTARDGSTIYVIPDTGIASSYGMAYDNISAGGPYLWMFSQAGSGAEIHQIDIATGAPTGVMHNVLADFPSAGIAGGLWASPDYIPGTLTIGGLVQGEDAFMYELCETENWVMITAGGSGTVPGNGGFIEVEVTFDATDLAIGDVLEGELVIANNSNYTRGDDYLIPVMLIVSGNIPPVNLNVDEGSGLFTWDTPPGSDSTDSGNEKQSKKEMNSRSRDLLGYNVFLDEDQVGTTTENEWLFVDLVIGDTYVAGVSAVYDDGESEIQEFEFTYQPDSAGEIVPLVTALQGNFPNPFNPVTQIAFSLNEQSHVQIMIYNIRGQLVRTLVDDQREANEYIVTWNGTDDSNKSVSSGVYFYKMKSSNYTATKKMILMK